MTTTQRSFPAPEDAAARYDAVLRRGRRLRRRRRLARGAGAGGTLLAGALAVALVMDGSHSEVRTADPATPAQFMSVHTEVSDDGVLTVTVQDPSFPDDPRAQQCVTVSLSPEDGPPSATAEGQDCGPDDGVVDWPVTASGGVLLSCAATQDATDPSPPHVKRTRAETGRFRLPLPVDELPPGRYRLTVLAVSGIGDGCDPTAPNELETIRSVTSFVEFP